MGTTRRVRRTGWAWDTFAQRIATPRLRDLAQQTTLNNYEKAKKMHFLAEFGGWKAARLGGRLVRGRDDLTIRGPLIAQ